MGAKRILLVEDNKDDELLTLRAIARQKLPVDVSVARDGVEAIDALLSPESVEDLPQLVLLDLNLPRLGGLDVLRRLRENDRTKHLPVVVLTSSREDQDIRHSYSLGANAYVRKPVDFTEFTEAMRVLGFFWLTLNEPLPV